MSITTQEALTRIIEHREGFDYIPPVTDDIH